MNGIIVFPNTHQTQPEMNAYFRAGSLQYSVTRVYLKLGMHDTAGCIWSSVPETECIVQYTEAVWFIRQV